MLPAEMHTLIMSGALDTTDGRRMWSALMTAIAAQHVCEIGVFKGDLAERVLDDNPAIVTYTLIDPWRNLSAWNKPANKSDVEFDAIRKTCMARLEPFSKKLRVLRGTTQEVIGSVPDQSLDALFIDGDHTLRGITLDLGLAFDKVRDGGVIGVDDFTRNIWQHGPNHDPSLVHPYTLHFCELHGIPCYSMPNAQAWMLKTPGSGFAFHDRFGYSEHSSQDIYGAPR